MAQTLTVCRIDAEWGFRDVTGVAYSRSSDIELVVQAARRTAGRIGGHVNFTPEADEHFRAISACRSIDSAKPPEPSVRPRFGSFWGRFVRGRRRK